MGHSHVDVGTRVRYQWCPPASGKHYFSSGVGPIKGGFYAQGEWEEFFARERLAVVESRTLSRFCRDWKQPYARSCFVLRVPP